MKGFHIYTDHWWRDPKHAVTTEATLVEVGPPKRPDGVATSGPYNPAPSGYFQLVTADVTDPKTGRTARATGELYFTGLASQFQAGQQIKVRWSAKREAIEDYNAATAPEAEWAAAVNAGGLTPVGAVPGAGVPLSGAGLSADQAARVSQALAGLGISGTSGVQVVGLSGTSGAGSHADPIEQLQKLAQLRESGILTEEEFTQQKQRILGGQ